MTVEEILKTEFSEEFVQHMKNAMILSFYKYGKASDAYPSRVNAIASLQDRLREYAKTGNTEFLVDASNFAMLEFMFPSLDGARFEPKDSDSSPGRRTYSGTRDSRDNKEVGDRPTTRVFK